jgi:hypothetical protein
VHGQPTGERTSVGNYRRQVEANQEELCQPLCVYVNCVEIAGGILISGSEFVSTRPRMGEFAIESVQGWRLVFRTSLAAIVPRSALSLDDDFTRV